MMVADRNILFNASLKNFLTRLKTHLFTRTSGPRSGEDGTFRFCRRVASCSIVGHESDTSIDDNDV